MNKDLKYYLQIHYPTSIRQYNDCGKRKYLVEYPDLPGCSSHGETPGKAYAMAEKAKKLWLETCIKEGIKIPIIIMLAIHLCFRFENGWLIVLEW